MVLGRMASRLTEIVPGTWWPLRQPATGTSSAISSSQWPGGGVWGIYFRVAKNEGVTVAARYGKAVTSQLGWAFLGGHRRVDAAF